MFVVCREELGTATSVKCGLVHYHIDRWSRVVQTASGPPSLLRYRRRGSSQLPQPRLPAGREEPPGPQRPEGPLPAELPLPGAHVHLTADLRRWRPARLFRNQEDRWVPQSTVPSLKQPLWMPLFSLNTHSVGRHVAQEEERVGW